LYKDRASWDDDTQKASMYAMYYALNDLSAECPGFIILYHPTPYEAFKVTLDDPSKFTINKDNIAAVTERWIKAESIRREIVGKIAGALKSAGRTPLRRT